MDNLPVPSISPTIKSYDLMFGIQRVFESKLKEIKNERIKDNKTGGCELNLSKYTHDGPRAAYDYIFLSNCLDDISPSKITFYSISLDSRGGRNSDVWRLIGKLVKIPVVEFKCCKLDVGFYIHFLKQSSFKTINLTFKACNVSHASKKAIVSILETNYIVRNLNIYNTDTDMYGKNTVDKRFVDDKSAEQSIIVNNKIKDYLHRNRAYHLCRLSALELILIRKYRNSVLDFLNISTIIHISKLIYSTKISLEWLNVIPRT